MRILTHLFIASLLLTLGCTRDYTATATIDMNQSSWQAEQQPDEVTPHGCCMSDPIPPAINAIRSDTRRN